MGKGSTQNLIRNIIKSLANSSKSITNISEEIGFDRTAISRYLNILKESGLVIEEQQGSSKIYTLVPKHRNDTYFGLPLELQTEKNFNSLYYLIRKYWNEQTPRKLYATHVQKIAYKVIKKCDLKLPFGWYIYGGIGVVSYNDSLEYTYYGFPKEIEDCVKLVTEEFIDKNTYQSKMLQYLEEKNELYLTKEKILAELYSSDFDNMPKKTTLSIIKKLRKLTELVPKNENGVNLEILDSYQDLMLDIATKLDINSILKHKQEIIQLFESVWRYIALFNFKQDLKEYYSKDILEIHFKLEILQQEKEIIEFGTDLQLLICDEEPTNPLDKKLNDALSKIQLLTPEAQKKQENKMKKLKEELGDEKYNEYLIKMFGLE